MNGLYFWVGDDVNGKSIISIKVRNQIECFEEAGFSMRFVGVENRRNFKENIIWFLPGIYNYTQNCMMHAFDEIDLRSIGFIYIRMPTASRALVDMCQMIKEKNPIIKIIIEIPTYPVIGERKGLKRVADWYAAYEVKKLCSFVDRIVTFSKDDIIWGIPTIRTVNCSKMDSIKRKRISDNSDTINVITVSSYDYWHGYDRFIVGMGEYYSSEGQHRPIHYYIVGEGAEIPKYKKLVKKYNLEQYVHFEGKHYGEELDVIYDKCEIALDSMGRHRSKIFYNSSLKGKEYCAKGLPIVSGVCTELDDYKDYPYYFRVPANDSPIQMNDIIRFYDSVYREKNKEDVANNIREFAVSHFDFKVGLKPIVDYIQQ